MVDAIVSVINTLLGMIVQPFTSLCVHLFTQLFSGIGNGLSTAWQNPIVEILLHLVYWASFALFLLYGLFYLLKIARERERNWYEMIACPFYALLFIFAAPLFAQFFFLLPDLLVSTVNEAIGETQLNGILNTNPFDGLAYSVMLLLTGVGIIGFTIVTFRRFGMMLLQVLLVPIYIPFLMLGDTKKAGEWLTSTAALGISYLIQYLLFYCGVFTAYVSEGKSIISTVIGCSLMLAIFSVDPALQRWGMPLDGSGRAFGAMAQGIRTTTQTVYTIRHLMR